MIMFFIIFIIDTDFSLSTTEKSRDDVLPLSYGQELELKKQDGEEEHNNTESLQNQTLSPAAEVNNKMQGTLIVTKKVINEGDGNSKQPSDFTIRIHGNNPSPSLFPEEFPGNKLGDGLLPCILIVKSDGCLPFPSPSLITFLVTINVPCTLLLTPVAACDDDVSF